MFINEFGDKHKNLLLTFSECFFSHYPAPVSYNYKYIQ